MWFRAFIIRQCSDCKEGKSKGERASNGLKESLSDQCYRIAKRFTNGLFFFFGGGGGFCNIQAVLCVEEQPAGGDGLAFDLPTRLCIIARNM